ncbi:RHS repeat protein [Cryobacterium sp. Hz9]|nr:RHS repeat protein [Cryobacterium sp. Hz9]
MGADLSLAALGGPLQSQRSYSSNVTRSSAFGPGWTFNYDAGLSIDSGTGVITYHSPTGALQAFTPDGLGGYLAPPAVASTLARVSGDGFALVNWDQSEQVFDSSGRLTMIKDRNGQGSILTYSGAQLLTASGSGRSLTFTWDSTGTRITQVVGSDGSSVQYGYDGSLKLISSTNLRGKITAYGYDGGGRLDSIRDPNGNYPVRLVYDSTSGRAIQQRDANGAITTFAWDEPTQTASTTDPRGLIAKDVYLNGYLVEQIDGAGNSTRYSWNDGGQMTRVSTATGETTRFEYDSRGNTIRRLAPVANVVNDTVIPAESYTYDASNNLISSTDFNNTNTQYTYDGAGNLLTVTTPDLVSGSGSVVSSVNTYNTNGTLATTADANAAVTQYAFSTAGDLSAITTATGRKTTYGYDGAGRPTSTVSSRGNVAGANPGTFTTTYTLNAVGQITQTVAPQGITTSTVYDNAGRATSTTDARGKVTATTYDADGHVTSVQGPDLTIPPALLTYDVDGNVLSQTSPAGIVTTFTYNSLNKRATAQTTGAGQYSYEYDAGGRLSIQTSPSGRTITMQRNQIGIVSSVSFTDGATSSGINYNYDLNGNRTSAYANGASQGVTYNALNKVASATDNNNNTWSYSYDNTGRTVSQTLPGAAPQQLSYDADGRLTKVAAGATTLVSYAYNDTTGDSVATLPGGVTQTTSIDAAGRPLKVIGAKGSTILTSSSYVLDGNGDPTSITDATGATDLYAYDSSSRLPQVCYSTPTCTRSTNSIKWTYDGDSKRLTETRPTGTTNYAYNSTGRLTSRSGASGAATYSYDADGNITNGGTSTFNWDAAGDLVSAGGSRPTTYTYDADGRRATTTTGNAVVRNLWSPTTGQLDIEQSASGDTLRRYTYGTSLVGLTSGTTNYSYLTDAQGSVRAVVDATGSAKLTYAYEPYGGMRSSTAGQKAPTNPRQYLSAFAEGTSYNLTARQYVPSIGQVLLPDPAANPGVGYQYGNANPMVNLDPFGKSASSWLSVTAGISGGHAATSGTVSSNCTQAALCSVLNFGPAPLSGVAGAVSGAPDGSAVSCASAKGGCASAVVNGAVNGSTAGGALNKAARLTSAKNDAWDTAGLVLGVAGVALFVAAFVVASPAIIVALTATAIAVSVASTVIACRKGVDVDCTISAVGTLAGVGGIGIKAGAVLGKGTGMGAQAAGAGLSSLGTMADATSLTVGTSRYASQGW